MKLQIACLALIVSATALVTGCRQSDGPMPQPEPDTVNRVGDMSRDLLGVVSGDPASSQDFADDLTGFARSPAVASVRTFAARLAETIKGTTLSDQAAQQLAQICWTVVAGRDLSQRQSELVRQEFRTQLVALGVADAAVQRTVADVAAAQTAVNTRPRRWYERF